jgi:mono/diheme cytochrome c family protein
MRTQTIRNLEFGIWTAFVCVLAIAASMHAQEGGKTVAEGVYTEAQASRGAASYANACANCHRADLTGNSGPALRDERFVGQFAGKDLKTLFTKTATTMPRGAPGSLGDAVYLDIVAHLLKENGFPAGTDELTADGLDAIRVLPTQPKPLPPVGDFSYVEVVGCLTRGPQHTWLLTRSSPPVATTPTSSTAASGASPASAAALGSQTVHLVDAMAYAPDAHNGHKMYVRGLLIKLPDEQRMTISAFEMVSPTCRD